MVNRKNDYLATVYGNYDEFENPLVIGEKRTNELVPFTSAGLTLDPSDVDTRVTVFEYENKTGADLWMLGLPTRSRVQEPIGVVSDPVNLLTDQVIANTYTDQGNLKTQSQYGSLTQYFYDSKGNVETVIDPNGNRFKSEDFVLGVAQIEKRSLTLAGAEQTFLTRVVDDKTGRVDSQTVFRDIAAGESYTTTIDYDDLGLSLIHI